VASSLFWLCHGDGQQRSNLVAETVAVAVATMAQVAARDHVESSITPDLPCPRRRTIPFPLLYRERGTASRQRFCEGTIGRAHHKTRRPRPLTTPQLSSRNDVFLAARCSVTKVLSPPEVISLPARSCANRLVLAFLPVWPPLLCLLLALFLITRACAKTTGV